MTNSAALTKKLKSIGPSHVKLSIIREPSKKPDPISRYSSRITATSPSISSSMLSPITVSSDSQHLRQNSKEDETILENPTDDPFY
ncbi:unnamed protein product [Caenorhabditis angaria]|uniref:Uncharacterized protein n=1 Tax=Caenorhabditis angaria TaxID=860376 RepID=A0A9P1IL69_9PELO|nr:unnamed protein product [Caenorhabditis angaria]